MNTENLSADTQKRLREAFFSAWTKDGGPYKVLPDGNVLVYLPAGWYGKNVEGRMPNGAIFEITRRGLSNSVQEVKFLRFEYPN